MDIQVWPVGGTLRPRYPGVANGQVLEPRLSNGYPVWPLVLSRGYLGVAGNWCV
jgi:hypothetical protein